MQIEDGKGSGNFASVDANNRLKTLSISFKEEMMINENGNFYSIYQSVTPTDAGDCFLYIQNNSQEILHIPSITLYTASAESVQLKLEDEGTPVGGSDIAPVNRFSGVGKTADVTVLGGIDITGLSGGVVVDEVFGSTTQIKRYWNSMFILDTNKSITFYAVTGGVALKIMVSTFFHDHL